MTDATPAYETRIPPQDDAALAAAAKDSPGGWVYDIDRPYPDDQYVPPEAIRGSWKVGEDGLLTGLYASNPRYRPIRRGARTLKPYMHEVARTNAGQWMAEIDPRGEPLFPDVPEHLIRGWWLVAADGTISEEFRPNSLYEPELRWSGDR